MRRQRQHIGNVLVDTGGVCVVDLVYTEANEADTEKLIAGKGPGVGIGCGRAPVGCHDHVGVWVQTGYGDGVYPVYAETHEDGHVSRIVIECDEQVPA